jgi:hypothetical protein
MTVPWSLTITAPGRIDTTIGIADHHDAAVTAVLAAAHGAVDDARRRAAPGARYELRAAAEPVAIIATGTDDAGRPDHTATHALLHRIDIERYLSAPPR